MATKLKVIEDAADIVPAAHVPDFSSSSLARARARACTANFGNFRGSAGHR